MAKQSTLDGWLLVHFADLLKKGSLTVAKINMPIVLYRKTIEREDSSYEEEVCTLVKDHVIIQVVTSVIPYLSELEQRATEEVTILTRTGSLCQINTKDEAMPLKMITNCELEEGAKVMVSYRDGLPFAKIELP